MPINADYKFIQARKKYEEAIGLNNKLKALQGMLSAAPTHKGAESLRKDIKTRIAKYKELIQNEKKSGKRQQLSIKKEGAATICILGKTRSGKSYLLNRLTNANVKEADYEFVTTKPEIGALDYKGIKLQIIEIPAIVKDFIYTEKGPLFLSVVRLADLVIFLIKDREDIKFLKKELEKAAIKKKLLIIEEIDIEKIKEKIWKKLDLIKVFTKQQGKKPSYPPIAFKRGSTVGDLAGSIHKDFIKRFKFARIWGESAKFDGQQVGLDHKLEDDDIVELHMR